MIPQQQVLQGGAIVVFGDLIVLRRSRSGKWIFPKGNVERGETSLQAAVRETQEETGLIVEGGEPAGSISFKDDGQRVDLDLFIFRALGPGPRWPKHRNVDTFLVPPEQVAAHLSFKKLRGLWEEARPRALALCNAAQTS